MREALLQIEIYKTLCLCMMGLGLSMFIMVISWIIIDNYKKDKKENKNERE